MAERGETMNQFTVEDVLKCIQMMKHELKWNELAFQFSLSDAEQAEIESTTPEGNERREAIVKRWLDGGGIFPSWRTLIWILDHLDEIKLADNIRERAEPSTDPTFNIENICSAMVCPNWKEVWSTLIPESRLDKIENECSKVGEQVHACAVVYTSHWNASWKQLAGSLYRWNHLGVLEKVKHFLPPKDPLLTLENMVSVMSLLTNENWKFVWCTFVPEEQLEVIKNKSSSIEERTHFCCSHYVSCCPTASWQDVARKLFRDAEAAAVERAKAFLQPKDPRLTTDNLRKAFEGFHGWEHLAQNLDIPDSVMNQISDIENIEQKKEAMFEVFVQKHPCPSWEIVVEALECHDHYRLANQLRVVYVNNCHV